MIVWRISNYSTLEGSGGLLASGRWHSKGRPIVYCAPNPATALLEVLVHTGELNPEQLPENYQFLKIRIPDSVVADHITAAELPDDRQDNQKITRARGNHWLSTQATAVLSVPSVIVPETTNILINPRHVESAQLAVMDMIYYPLDQRFHRMRQ